jgi:hypothetical protein
LRGFARRALVRCYDPVIGEKQICDYVFAQDDLLCHEVLL